MIERTIERNEPVVPTTLDEALRLGFKPITNVDAFLTEKYPELLLGHQHLMATQTPVDCSDPANGGRRCRTVLDKGGNAVVIGFCFNGACYYTGR